MIRYIAVAALAAACLAPSTTRPDELEGIAIDKSKACASLQQFGPRYCVIPEKVLDAIAAANARLAAALEAERAKKTRRCAVVKPQYKPDANT